MGKAVSITIIIPFGNDEAAIAARVHEVATLARELPVNLMLVTDRSTDNTEMEALRAIASPDCRHLQAELRRLRRTGSAATFLRGVIGGCAEGWLAFMDVTRPVDATMLQQAIADAGTAEGAGRRKLVGSRVPGGDAPVLALFHTPVPCVPEVAADGGKRVRDLLCDMAARAPADTPSSPARLSPRLDPQTA